MISAQVAVSPRAILPLGTPSGYLNIWGYGDDVVTLVEGIIVDDRQGHLWKVGESDSLFSMVRHTHFCYCCISTGFGGPDLHGRLDRAPISQLDVYRVRPGLGRLQ